MEKIKTYSNFNRNTDCDYFQQTKPSLKQQELTQNNRLYQLIPKAIRVKYQKCCSSQQEIFKCLRNLHTHNKVQDLYQLFQQIGGVVNVWVNKSTAEQKGQYLLEALQKNIEQKVKKINSQSSSYINVVNNNRKIEKQNKNILQKQRNNDFQWLTLNTKNQMLKQKLKTKLVQTINQYKNQKKLREVIDRKLEDHQKIHLEDQSIDFYQQQKDKINYKWTAEDQNMFLNNIKKLKDKFIKTEFLKNCHRYKFITDCQLKTLAAEEISRKLDKSNKAFLSRQFLLDKYFSSKQSLTDKQMKFILKTSPLLSKCVDKAFVRSAIKNIKYQDIDKMQLQIAQEIIDKFQMIRNQVKQSRKLYKQTQNQNTKNKIFNFQKQKLFLQKQQQIIGKLHNHKTKMIRNLKFRPNTAKISTQNKQNNRISDQQQQKAYKKIGWPVPLNKFHPSTGLFIRDCSEQLNQEFNEYEKNYLNSLSKSQAKNWNKSSNQPDQKAKIVKFYTGGPLDTHNANKNFNYTPTNTAFIASKQTFDAFDADSFKILTQAFKTVQYRRDITQKLNTIQLNQDGQIYIPHKGIELLKPIMDLCFVQFCKKSKRSNSNEQEDLIINPVKKSLKKVQSTTEKMIKDKIIQGRQKAKMSIYIKKLLSLAAENSFLALKALNIKFTPTQINSVDSKGNTALYYATKHRNVDFIDYLLSFKADVNICCLKGTTPLHNAFKSSNYSIICKCLMSTNNPNLNTLDDQRKTPLAYCCQKVLKMLGLQQGVVYVEPNLKMKFDNNSLLHINDEANRPHEQLQMKFDVNTKTKQKQQLNPSSLLDFIMKKPKKQQ